MNINDLKNTLEFLSNLDCDNQTKNNATGNKGIQHLIGEYVIIRTYSAGNWFGKLDQKSGNEVILKDARRMWRWFAKQSVALSGVAKYGIVQDKSKIEPAINSVWLEAIEILELTDEAKNSIKGANDAVAG